MRRGFRADSGGEHVYFAPDADVLLDDAFASGYCFHIAYCNLNRGDRVMLEVRREGMATVYLDPVLNTPVTVIRVEMKPR